MTDPIAMLAVRLRATGTLPVTVADDDTWAELGRRLVRTGRRLVLVDDGGQRHHLIGWGEGHGPPVDHPAIELPGWSPVPLRIFAVALRACWPDRTTAPHPGVGLARRRLLTALGYNPDPVKAGGGGVAQAKAFLDTLCDAGLLRIDNDDVVWLGPVVAGWNTTTIEAYRRVYDRLPTAEATR